MERSNRRGHHTRLSSSLLLLLLLLTFYPLYGHASWMWLGLSSAGVAEERGCADLPFTRVQKALCRARPSLLPSIQAGARLGLAECQTQFRHERWNCTTSKDAQDASVFGYELTSGTKEAAFIHAVMTAGLVHAVTRACSQGIMAECGCDASLQGLGPPTSLQGLGLPTSLQGLGPPASLQGLGPPTSLQGLGLPTSLQGLGLPTSLQGLGLPTSLQGLGLPTSLQGLGSPAEGWQWGGCSDHTHYAAWFSRKFLDGAVRNASSLRVMSHALLAVNQHNSDAGRQAVDRTMATDCRCHGVSGSCAVKTCWRSMAPLGRVGAVLKERFERSVEVRQSFSRHKVRRKDKLMRRVPVGRDKLIYLHKSPNYCLEDAGRGILGTRGRHCSRASRGPDGCGLLCCGRGYDTRVVRHVQRCHCKFVWCCNVRCRRCESMNDIHTCK